MFDEMLGPNGDLDPPCATPCAQNSGSEVPYRPNYDMRVYPFLQNSGFVILQYAFRSVESRDYPTVVTIRVWRFSSTRGIDAICESAQGLEAQSVEKTARDEFNEWNSERSRCAMVHSGLGPPISSR